MADSLFDPFRVIYILNSLLRLKTCDPEGVKPPKSKVSSGSAPLPARRDSNQVPSRNTGPCYPFKAASQEECVMPFIYSEGINLAVLVTLIDFAEGNNRKIKKLL
jgi:hypothetical protein